MNPIFVVPVFQGPRTVEYVAGLYAIQKAHEMNVYQAFIEQYRNPKQLLHFWEQHAHILSNTWKNELSFSETVVGQLNAAEAYLFHAAKKGRLLSRSGWMGFTDIDRGLSRHTTFTLVPSAAQKYRAKPIAAEWSVVRIYGIQFGEDIVLVTGAGIKITRTTQEDPAIQALVEDAKKWAILFSDAGLNYRYFQGVNTKPLILDDDEQEN